MTPPFEARLIVSKVQDTKSKDDSVVVTLKGVKTIIMRTSDGYEYEAYADLALTVKVGSMKVAKALGIDEYENTRILILRDQDLSLEAFEESMEVSVSPSLDAYRGSVPDEVLDTLESAVPEHILKEIA